MKYIYKLLPVFLGLLMIRGCTPEEENLFEESASIRMKKTLTSYHKILCDAPNGWDLQYFPSPRTDYGGWHLLMKFSRDSVKAASELAPKQTASIYKLTEANGPTLMFDTYNNGIHIFSEPRNKYGIGNKGKGMEGDYAFVIMEASPEKIVLRGVKSGKNLTMTPIDKNTDWNDYFTAIENREEAMKLTETYFEYPINDRLYKVSNALRNMEVTYPVSGGELMTVSQSYIVNPEGMKFYEPFEINGVKIKSLEYKQEGNSWALVSPENNSIRFIPIRPAAKLAEAMLTYNMFGSGRGWNYVEGSPKVQNALNGFIKVMKETENAEFQTLEYGPAKDFHLFYIALKDRYTQINIGLELFIDLDPIKNEISFTVGDRVLLSSIKSNPIRQKHIVDNILQYLKPVFSGSYSVEYIDKGQKVWLFDQWWEFDKVILTKTDDPDIVISGYLL